MAAKRKVSNPLALAVLALLVERPMHPYEMASLMRERHMHGSIKLNYGSLYTVVEALHRQGLIAPRETLRDGRRPERTVYEPTEAGRTELHDWLRELLSRPVKEYPQFAAGLSLMGRLPAAELVALLEERTRHLEQEIGQARSISDDLLARGLPRIVLIENEYELMLREAELGWVRTLAREIADGTLAWPTVIRLKDGTLVWERTDAESETAGAAGTTHGGGPVS